MWEKIFDVLVKTKRRLIICELILAICLIALAVSAHGASVSVTGDYTDDQDTAYGVQVETDFGVLATELNRVNALSWEIQIQSVTADATNPPDTEVVGNSNLLLLDPDTEEPVRFYFRIPAEASASNAVNIAVIFSGDGTASANAVLDIDYRVTTTDEVLGTGGNSSNDTVTLTPVATEDTQKITSSDLQIAATDINAVGEYVEVKLYRDADEGADTYGGDLKIVGITVTGTKS